MATNLAQPLLFKWGVSVWRKLALILPFLFSLFGPTISHAQDQMGKKIIAQWKRDDPNTDLKQSALETYRKYARTPADVLRIVGLLIFFGLVSLTAWQWLSTGSVSLSLLMLFLLPSSMIFGGLMMDDLKLFQEFKKERFEMYWQEHGAELTKIFEAIPKSSSETADGVQRVKEDFTLDRFSDADLSRLFDRTTPSARPLSEIFSIENGKSRKAISDKLENSILAPHLLAGKEFFEDYTRLVVDRLGDNTQSTRGFLLEPYHELKRSLELFVKRYVNHMDRERSFPEADRIAKEFVQRKHSIPKNISTSLWPDQYPAAHHEYKNMVSRLQQQEVQRIGKTQDLPPQEVAKWKSQTARELQNLSDAARQSAYEIVADSGKFYFAVEYRTTKPTPITFRKWLSASPVRLSKEDVDAGLVYSDRKVFTDAKSLKEFLDTLTPLQRKTVQIQTKKYLSKTLRGVAWGIGFLLQKLSHLPSVGGWLGLKIFSRIPIFRTLNSFQKPSVGDPTGFDLSLQNALTEIAASSTPAERAVVIDSLDRALRLEAIARQLDPMRVENVPSLRQRLSKLFGSENVGIPGFTIAYEVARKGLALMSDSLGHLEMSGYREEMLRQAPEYLTNASATFWRHRDLLATQRARPELLREGTPEPPVEGKISRARLDFQNYFLRMKNWKRAIMVPIAALAIYAAGIATAAGVYNLYKYLNFHPPAWIDGRPNLQDRTAFKLTLENIAPPYILEGYFDMAAKSDWKEFEKFISKFHSSFREEQLLVGPKEWIDLFKNRHADYQLLILQGGEGVRQGGEAPHFTYEDFEPFRRELGVYSAGFVRVSEEVPGFSIPTKLGFRPVEVRVQYKDDKPSSRPPFVVYDKKKELTFVYIPELKNETAEVKFTAYFASNIRGAADWSDDEIVQYAQRDRELFTMDLERVKWAAQVLDYFGEKKISADLPQALNRNLPTLYNDPRRLARSFQENSLYSYIPEGDPRKKDWDREEFPIPDGFPQSAAEGFIFQMHSLTRFLNPEGTVCYQCDGAGELAESVLRFLYTPDENNKDAREWPVVENHPNFYNKRKGDGDSAVPSPDLYELNTNEGHQRTVVRSEDGKVRTNLDFTPYEMDPRNPKKKPSSPGFLSKFFGGLKSTFTPNSFESYKAFNKGGESSSSSSFRKLWDYLRSLLPQFSTTPSSGNSAPRVPSLSDIQLLPLKSKEQEEAETDLHLRLAALEADLLPDGPTSLEHAERMKELDTVKKKFVKQVEGSYGQDLFGESEGDLFRRTVRFANKLKDYSERKIRFQELILYAQKDFSDFVPPGIPRPRDLPKLLTEWRKRVEKRAQAYGVRALELRKMYDKSKEKLHPPRVETLYSDFSLMESYGNLADTIANMNWAPVTTREACKGAMEALLTGKRI